MQRLLKWMAVEADRRSSSASSFFVACRRASDRKDQGKKKRVRGRGGPWQLPKKELKSCEAPSWEEVKRPLVQILVEVAKSGMEIPTAEEEQAFAWSVVLRELVGPNL